jgi:hypothetical protein
MALRVSEFAQPDDLERMARHEKRELRREAKAEKLKNDRPSTEAQRRRLHQTMIANAFAAGRLSSPHANGRAGKYANQLAARRRKNVAARKSRRANRG